MTTKPVKKFEVGKRYKDTSGNIFLCVAVHKEYSWMLNIKSGNYYTFFIPKTNCTKIPDIDLDMFPTSAKWAWYEARSVYWSSLNPQDDEMATSSTLCGVIYGSDISDYFTRLNPLDLDQLRKDLA